MRSNHSSGHSPNPSPQPPPHTQPPPRDDGYSRDFLTEMVRATSSGSRLSTYGSNTLLYGSSVSTNTIPPKNSPVRSSSTPSTLDGTSVSYPVVSNGSSGQQSPQSNSHYSAMYPQLGENGQPSNSAPISYSVPLPPSNPPASSLEPPTLFLPASPITSSNSNSSNANNKNTSPPSLRPANTYETFGQSNQYSHPQQYIQSPQQSYHQLSQTYQPQPPSYAPFSPPSHPSATNTSTGSHTDEYGSDEYEDPGSTNSHSHSQQRDQPSALPTGGSYPPRPSNMSSRSTSGDLPGEGEQGHSIEREDSNSLSRTINSRQNSNSQVGSSPFDNQYERLRENELRRERERERTRLDSIASGVSSPHHDLANTAAPPLLISPEQFDSFLNNAPPSLMGNLSPIVTLSPYGDSSSSMVYKRPNYYDELPDPVAISPTSSALQSIALSFPVTAPATGAASPIHPSGTPPAHSRNGSPIPPISALARMCSSGSAGISSRADALSEDAYWEQVNSNTFPSRRFSGRNLSPNGTINTGSTTSAANMPRPMYFNPADGPSQYSGLPPSNIPPVSAPVQMGRVHSMMNPSGHPQIGSSPYDNLHHSSLGGNIHGNLFPPSAGSGSPLTSPPPASGIHNYKNQTWSPALHAQSSIRQQQHDQRWNQDPRMYAEGEQPTTNTTSGHRTSYPPTHHGAQSQHHFHHSQSMSIPPTFQHANTLPVRHGSMIVHSTYSGSSSRTSPHLVPFGSSSRYSQSVTPTGLNTEGEGQTPIAPDDPRSSTASPEFTSPQETGDTGTGGDSDMELIDWLKANHFDKYITNFLENEVSLDMIRAGEIEDKDLVLMGIRALGARKNILHAIRALKEQPTFTAPTYAATGPGQFLTPYYSHSVSGNSEGGASSSASSQQNGNSPLPTTPAPISLTPTESTSGTPRAPSPFTGSEGNTNVSLARNLSTNYRIPSSITHHPNSDLASALNNSSKPINNNNNRGSGGTLSSMNATTAALYKSDIHARSMSSDSLHQQLHQQQSQPSLTHLPLHISFLQASPLLHSESPGRSHALNIEKETELIRDSLIESGRAFRVRFAVATKDNLLKMLTKGTRALHISGHGDPHHLILENGLGGVEALDQHILKNLLIVGGSDLQFVFISSCFSYRAAVAFIAAGVKHVIAVQEDTQVSDTSARAFAAHVYLALCQGRSVREAFHKGQAAVLASNNGKSKNEACCCAHLHANHCTVCDTCRSPVCCSVHTGPCHQTTRCCNTAIPHGESLKFLLLPKEEGANHDVRLFDDVSEGRWVDLTPPKPPNNLPSIPDHFTGRSQDVFAVIQLALSSRLTTVTGHVGIGKSALARAVGTYINDRRHFEHGVFLVRAAKIGKRDPLYGLTGPLAPTSTAGIIVPPTEPIQLAHEMNLLISRAMGVDFSSGTAQSLHNNNNHSHHGHHSHNNNIHLDPDSLQEHLLTYLKDKHVLLILDDVDEFMINVKYRSEMKAYLKNMLDCTYGTHLIVTANLYQSNLGVHTNLNQASLPPQNACSGASAIPASSIIGVGIPGHTSKLYQLGPLHLLDSVVLLIHRFPRDLRPEEYGRMRNVQDFGEGQPIIQRLRGNPRLLEWAAELLNHLSLEQLTFLLCQPVLNLHHSTSACSAALTSPHPTAAANDPHATANHRMEWIMQQSVWSDLTTEAQTLIRRLVLLLESLCSTPFSSSTSHTPDRRLSGVFSPVQSNLSPPAATELMNPTSSNPSTTHPHVTVDSHHLPTPAPTTSPVSAPATTHVETPKPVPDPSSVHRTQSQPNHALHLPPQTTPQTTPQPQPSPFQTTYSPVAEMDDSDGYDHNAPVLSPAGAPHGDTLHSQVRKLERETSIGSRVVMSPPSNQSNKNASFQSPISPYAYLGSNETKSIDELAAEARTISLTESETPTEPTGSDDAPKSFALSL